LKPEDAHGFSGAPRDPRGIGTRLAHTARDPRAHHGFVNTPIHRGSTVLFPTLDALEAAIPGGSISGAPKHRACEIISNLERVGRGCYCGSIGYVGFDGTADFNLLIRTFVVGPDSISFAAGGGITAASDPAAGGVAGGAVAVAPLTPRRHC
jgi:hypothetical protein